MRYGDHDRPFVDVPSNPSPGLAAEQAKRTLQLQSMSTDDTDPDRDSTDEAEVEAEAETTEETDAERYIEADVADATEAVRLRNDGFATVAGGPADLASTDQGDEVVVPPDMADFYLENHAFSVVDEDEDGDDRA